MYTDTEMLDWLDKQTGSYASKVIWRWSVTGRGWRLHESELPGASETVRAAIAKGMRAEERRTAEGQQDGVHQP